MRGRIVFTVNLEKPSISVAGIDPGELSIVYLPTTLAEFAAAAKPALVIMMESLRFQVPLARAARCLVRDRAVADYGGLLHAVHTSAIAYFLERGAREHWRFLIKVVGEKCASGRAG